MALRIKKTLHIEGMSCLQCEKIITRALMAAQGVKEVKVSYKEATAVVLFDHELVTLDVLIKAIEDEGYTATEMEPGEASKKWSLPQLAGIGILIAAVYLLINNTVGFNALPEVQANMGYGMLFVVGLLTSVHCIAMCGGINLSQCMNAGDGVSKSSAGFLYNGGRVVSYTIIGGLVGALGSVFSLSGAARGSVSLLAGIFMMIMGINMLGILPGLRKFNLNLPAGLRIALMGKNGKRGPFVVGLLNGLMPCGPLQTMQLYALGTGSALSGALSMFFFSLGTVPLMLGFSLVSAMLSKRMTKNMVKAGAILVVVLGLLMFQRGLSLSGVSGLSLSPSEVAKQTVVIEDETQRFEADVLANAYPEILLQKGIPATINLRVTEENLNGCNNAIVIPAFGIEMPLAVGDNWITFTPDQSGTFPYSCWMGMITSKITVVDDLELK